jgi:hypothetical protein
MSSPSPPSKADWNAAVFFDDHPRFLDTSETAADLDRLNLRHEAIIADNVDVLRGARVLDIASHDGRWALGALLAGALHVTGIEARPHLIEHAKANLAAEGASAESYEFVCVDVFDWLAQPDRQVDVVLCAGFVYHTLRYSELFAGIRSTGARYVIVDSAVLPPRLDRPVIDIVAEPGDPESNAVTDRYSHRGRTLVGTPSVAALQLMLELHDFEIEKTFDWAGLLDRHPESKHVRQYRKQARVTIRAAQRPLSDRVTRELRRGAGRTARRLLGDATVNRIRKSDRRSGGSGPR